MMASKCRPYRLEIEAPANGRVHRATIRVLDTAGHLILTDKADLSSLEEIRKVAKRLAKRLDVEPEELEAQLTATWNAAADRRWQQQQAFRAGDADAAPQVEAELLDTGPAAVPRPLCLVEGRAYAAAWVHVGRTTRRTVDPESGQVTDHDPPLVTVESILIIIRDDGRTYADPGAGVPGARPLDELGLAVCLPAPPPPDRAWSGAGVKRYVAGERPVPAEVFRRLVRVVDRYIDFGRSLAPQEAMCELVACYVLATYLLDAFHVIGYLWPNGESGSGKTTMLQVVTETAYLGQLSESEAARLVLRLDRLVLMLNAVADRVGEGLDPQPAVASTGPCRPVGAGSGIGPADGPTTGHRRF
jgi:hypothetical protein